MDAKEYADGRGAVRIRARIRIKDEDTVVISDIPPGTTTESLIGSIEDAAKKGKLKVRAISDFAFGEGGDCGGGTEGGGGGAVGGRAVRVHAVESRH